jgi:hypothetical protein
MGIANSVLIVVRKLASLKLLVATVLQRDDSGERLQHTRQANLGGSSAGSEPAPFRFKSVPRIVALGRSDPRRFQARNL